MKSALTVAIACLLTACASQPASPPTVISATAPIADTSSKAIATPVASWQPGIPMPDEFDWIRLTSDEWLKGELIAVYQDEMEFDSDELGLLLLDLDDIAEIRSHHKKSVRFNDGEILVGQIYLRDNQVAVLGSEGDTHPLTEMVSIATGADERLQLWNGKLFFGANLHEGSTSQKDYSGELELKRRTSINRTQLKYLGSYTTTNSVETENNHRFNTGFDWFYSTRTFIKLMDFEYFRDPFQNIDNRITYFAGGGYYVVDTSRTTWDVFAGAGYQRTRYEAVAADDSDEESTPGLGFGTDINHEATGDFDILFSYSGQIVSHDAGQYNQHLEAGIEYEIINDFDIDVTFIWDRVEEPKATDEGITPEKNDTRLVIGVNWEF